MIVPVMAISKLVLTRQIYSEETNGAHAHYREPVPLISWDKMAAVWQRSIIAVYWFGVSSITLNWSVTYHDRCCLRADVSYFLCAKKMQERTVFSGADLGGGGGEGGGGGFDRTP